MCAGFISDFSVTISGDTGNPIFQGYEVMLRVTNITGNASSVVAECKFGFQGTNELACATVGTRAEIDPGSEVYVEVNGLGGPIAQSFDWSAGLSPPGNVYP